MKPLVATNAFKKDLKRCQKRHNHLDKLQRILRLLQAGQPIPTKHRPHKLVGRQYSPGRASYWECHIEPDWLLIYDVTPTQVNLRRTGSHADLFA